jgi:hypothetical protein
LESKDCGKGQWCRWMGAKSRRGQRASGDKQIGVRCVSSGVGLFSLIRKQGYRVRVGRAEISDLSATNLAEMKPVIV